MQVHKILFVVAAIIFAAAIALIIADGFSFPLLLIVFTCALLAASQAHMYYLASREYFE